MTNHWGLVNASSLGLNPAGALARNRLLRTTNNARNSDSPARNEDNLDSRRDRDHDDDRTYYVPDQGYLWTLEEALEAPDDMRMVLPRQKTRDMYRACIMHETELIEGLVMQHLQGRGVTRVRVHPDREKAYRYENVYCIVTLQVETNRSATMRSVILKIMIAEFCGETHFPGNVEEKVRCVAATHVYVSRHCPEISVPALLGFGLPGGVSFFTPQALSWFDWLKWQTNRFWRRLWGLPTPTEFIRQERTACADVGYFILESHDPGLQVMNDIDVSNPTDVQRGNFYRGIARIVLSLARVTQPHIGSWTIDDDGEIQLANRPLDMRIHAFEALGIWTGMHRKTIYASVYDYYNELLQIHEMRMLYHPKSFVDEHGGYKISCDILLARTMMCLMTAAKYNHGPFVMQMCYSPLKSFLVDTDWNIKAMLNLEWICSRPVDAILLPFELHIYRGQDPAHPVDVQTNYMDVVSLFEAMLCEEDTEQELSSLPKLSQIVKTSRSEHRGLYFDALRDEPSTLSHFFKTFVTDYREKGNPLMYFYGDKKFIEEKLESLSTYEEEVRQVFRKYCVAMNEEERQEYFNSSED